MAQHPKKHHGSGTLTEEPEPVENPVETASDWPQPEPPAQQPAAPAAPTPAADIMALAAPPIQLRSTYPPGQPAMSAPPRTLGKTPTTVNQIMYPDGIQATHFVGPIVSGPTPGVQGASGSAELALTLQVDYTQGNYSIPIQFPGGSFLKDITAVTVQAFAGTTPPTISLGSQANGTDILASLTIPAPGAVEAPVNPAAQLPLWGAVSPLAPFQMWLTVAGGAGLTAGLVIVLITYYRLAAPWSPPAADYSRPGNF